VRFVLWLVLFGCGDNVDARVTLAVPTAWTSAFDEFVAFTPELAFGEGGYHIEVVDDPTIPLEGYQLEQTIVHAHDVLGAQYGVAAALEHVGYRFRHPLDTFHAWRPAAATEDTALHVPQVRVRGFQLHTLHPIEGYFAFWEPDPANTRDAHRIIDWLVKNRGNYLQWVGLDDIMEPGHHATWQAFTRELIDYAHLRGVRVGINMQLFGRSNLQLAFDLHDDDAQSISDSVAARLPLITQDLPFDVYALSFGEFFGADPQKLIDATNEVARQLRELAPQAEMHATVHVGAKQRVTYMGRDLLYYFLVQYCDPSIIPDIHSVMYYNLYDDAGGAYQHDTFAEHRQYLLDRMCAGQRAAYFPETAYWIAFDDSMPTYTPVYVYSRWRDLAGLAQDGCGKPLDEQLIFSSGWEWGYWLHDVTALRASYELAEPGTLIADAFGSDLAPAAALVEALATEQKHALIDERLAPYMAGRDVAIDTGAMLDPPIVSQPDRITFDELVGDPAIESFEASVLVPLRAHADALDALADQLAGTKLPVSRWSHEVRDGFAIDQLRARFVLATYGAVLAHLRGEGGDAEYAEAQALLAQAHAIVSSRHANLHDSHGRRLVGKTPNSTFYQFGYLYMAETLCYWQRELDQVGGILGNTTKVPNGCLF